LVPFVGYRLVVLVPMAVRVTNVVQAMVRIQLDIVLKAARMVDIVFDIVLVLD
jgi:hypothetical protein